MKKYVLLIFCSLLMVTYIQAQSKVCMPYIETINLDSMYRYSLSRLFKTYYEFYHPEEVILMDYLDLRNSENTLSIINAKAKGCGAEKIIFAEANKVGNTTIFKFELKQANSNENLWTDVLKASSEDDYDPIIQRAANKIGTETKASEIDDIYSITNYESRSHNKVKVSVMPYFSLYNVGGQAPSGVMLSLGVMFE